MTSITFIIPVSPKHFPFEAIQHIRQLSFPERQIEILVVEGKRPSLQRNSAVLKATGELIYFLDDDSFVDSKCLEKCLRHFEDPAVVAVGGPAITYEDASLLESCFGAALGSGFGAGAVKSRSRVIGCARQVRGEELILCNMLVRKDAFLECGGLNASLYPNEENEFLKRLRQKGFKFFYDPEMLVRRSRRNELGQFVQQMMSYGNGRAKHIFKQFAFKDLFFLIPSQFVCYLFAFACLHTAWMAVPAIVYLLMSLVASARVAARQKSWKHFFILQAVFPTMHISYGLGVLEGLISLWNGADISLADAKIKIFTIKPLKSLHPNPMSIEQPDLQPAADA